MFFNNVTHQFFSREIGLKDKLKPPLENLKDSFFSEKNKKIYLSNIDSFSILTEKGKEFFEEFLGYSNAIFENYGAKALNLFFNEIKSTTRIIEKIQENIKNLLPQDIFKIIKKNILSNEINLFLDRVSNDKIVLFLYITYSFKDLESLSVYIFSSNRSNPLPALFAQYHKHVNCIKYQSSQKIAAIYEILFLSLNDQSEEMQIVFSEQWFSIVKNIMKGKEYLTNINNDGYYQLLSRTIVNMSYIDRYLELIDKNNKQCKYKINEIHSLKNQIRDFIFQEMDNLIMIMNRLYGDKNSIITFLLRNINQAPKNSYKGAGLFLIESFMNYLKDEDLINFSEEFLSDLNNGCIDEIIDKMINLKPKNLDVEKTDFNFLRQGEIAEIILAEWKEFLKKYLSSLKSGCFRRFIP